MVEERIKTYEEEEKALRVIIMEEEGEREKKEKQQRLEQKALLNLSKGERKFEEIKGPFILASFACDLPITNAQVRKHALVTNSLFHMYQKFRTENRSINCKCK
jgi:hypothetical protein